MEVEVGELSLGINEQQATVAHSKVSGKMERLPPNSNK